jgi:hypothetical protein
MFDSPVDITGNSKGSPPASHTPRLTRSAIWRKCALQGVSSDQVLQMPITGRPSNTWSGNPWLRIQLRCTKPSLSVLANQAAERYFRFSSDMSASIPFRTTIMSGSSEMLFFHEWAGKTSRELTARRKTKYSAALLSN